MNYSLEEQLDILKKNFNNYSLTLSVILADVNPCSSFGIYKSVIERLVNINSSKMIDTFILSALKYEDKIMEGDDDFFLKKDYGNELGEDKNNIIKVFEFKSIWDTLCDQNKDIIKLYMQLLCKIARKYYDLVYDALYTNQ